MNGVQDLGIDRDSLRKRIKSHGERVRVSGSRIWKAFLSRVPDGDRSLQDHLRRLAGYAPLESLRRSTKRSPQRLRGSINMGKTSRNTQAPTKKLNECSRRSGGALFGSSGSSLTRKFRRSKRTILRTRRI